MPIISKKRFYDHTLNPLSPRSAELPILLCCMRLLMWHPGAEPQPHPEHMSIKRVILEAENAGILTLTLLQAKILLAIFELGHALYPAAYLSIASCARFGIALGLNKCLESGVFSNPSAAVLEAEEKKRAWWAILILDRFMQLGNPAQTLCTEDPTSSSYLPSDDRAFEHGVISKESFRITSPASVEMGMLARMAQATFLLGRVFRLQSAHFQPDDADAREAERWQLDATIRALLNLSYAEGSLVLQPVCAQTSICYSALIILHDPTSMRIDTDHFKFAMEVIKPVVDDMSWASGIMFQDRVISVADASPLLLLWAYQAITIYRRLEQRYGDQVQAPLALMQEKLRIMPRRWKVGEAYSQILDAREITQMDVLIKV